MQLSPNHPHKSAKSRIIQGCICLALLCTLLSAMPVDVDVESQQHIEYTLANPQMLHDTTIAWQTAEWWLLDVLVEPGMARAAFTELGFTDAETLLHGQAAMLFDRLERARGQRDRIRCRAANSGREMDSGERQRYLEFEGQAVQLDDSLEQARSRFLGEITASKLQRFNRWLREQRFLEAVVGAKVGQAFYGLVNFGPGFNDAPDSLNSAWKLLESSQSYRELVERTAESAYRSLSSAGRIPRSDSAEVIDLLRDYRARILRARVDLVVADKVAFKLVGTGSGVEPVRSFVDDKVQFIDGLREKLFAAVEDGSGGPADRLEEVWIP